MVAAFVRDAHDQHLHVAPVVIRLGEERIRQVRFVDRAGDAVLGLHGLVRLQMQKQPLRNGRNGVGNGQLADGMQTVFCRDGNLRRADMVHARRIDRLVKRAGNAVQEEVFHRRRLGARFERQLRMRGAHRDMHVHGAFVVRRIPEPDLDRRFVFAGEVRLFGKGQLHDVGVFDILHERVRSVRAADRDFTIDRLRRRRNRVSHMQHDRCQKLPEIEAHDVPAERRFRSVDVERRLARGEVRRFRLGAILDRDDRTHAAIVDQHGGKQHKNSPRDPENRAARLAPFCLPFLFHP